MIADVSEPSICSIFIGRSMQYDRGFGMCGVFIPDRFRQAGRGTNGKVSDRLGGGYDEDGTDREFLNVG
jgi:hypothetical protein